MLVSSADNTEIALLTVQNAQQKGLTSRQGIVYSGWAPKKQPRKDQLQFLRLIWVYRS